MSNKKDIYIGVRVPEYLVSLIDETVRQSNGSMDRSEVIRAALMFFFALMKCGLHKIIKPMPELKKVLIKNDKE